MRVVLRWQVEDADSHFMNVNAVLGEDGCLLGCRAV
jgi:hypothetical protein